MGLSCPTCGNARNFFVKTLQMHVVQLNDARVDVSDEGKPGVIEMLCDECESPIAFEGVDDETRKEILLQLGAR